jgi:Lon-like ATP-dependent protease
LEVLDPEQNNTFRDHYLDVPVDLSQVLFICTANVLDTIPGPLLDRMEVIRIAGYVHEEKVAIAKQYLVPQTCESSGVGKEDIGFTTQALDRIISEYAREAGVRQLRKLLEKISRKVALKKVRGSSEFVEIDAPDLPGYIGQPLYLSDRMFDQTPPGVVTGLAWTALGGVTLYIEARGRLRGPGHMHVTGKLGDVMRESSEVSLTYARLFVQELSSENAYLDRARIHLHVPEGATPKDGPSAGITMASALVSLALNAPVKPDLAMTGELTLTGKVRKVGGIKEKVLAARREGLTTLILPRQNEADYLELKDHLREGLTAYFVDHFDDVYQLAFDQDLVPGLRSISRGEPVVTVGPPDLHKTENPEMDISLIIPVVQDPQPSLRLK